MEMKVSAESEHNPYGRPTAQTGTRPTPGRRLALLHRAPARTVIPLLFSQCTKFARSVCDCPLPSDSLGGLA